MTSEKRSFSGNANGERRERGTDTMQDVDHTHPHTNETFGAAFVRGPAVAADGGERDAVDPDGESTASADETMEDVDHEAPGEGVSRAYERGTEGRDESV
ncbi:hypothetical protein ACFQGE_18595 [Halomicroarcula sp. GCM10025817]|uniref:hypothetical protein n=1 Tax=Haloarcula TaxID=2237 RepID=UPI0023E83DC9|nr:hypothetical protein [Halomicroarcula sp. SYNS111]